MAGPNTNFELTVHDMELIEDALRTHEQSLSDKLLEADGLDDEVKDELLEVQGLLGRLHNQKEFYRPKTGAYVGG